MHGKLVKEHTQLYGACWLVQMLGELVFINIPAIKLCKALVDTLQVTDCERHLVFSKFLTVHLSVASQHRICIRK